MLWTRTFQLLPSNLLFMIPRNFFVAHNLSQGAIYLAGSGWSKNDQSIMATCDSSSCHIQTWQSNDCSGAPDYAAGLSNSCGVCYPINVLLTFQINNVGIHTHALATPQDTWRTNLMTNSTHLGKPLSLVPAGHRDGKVIPSHHEFMAGERSALESSQSQLRLWKDENAEAHENSTWWFPPTN